MDKLRLVELRGSYYDIGYRHGERFADDIRHFADERVALCSEGVWSGRRLSRAEVLSLASACVAEHEAYAPELVEEMEGMAAACGVSIPELVIVNGFTDFVDTLHAVYAEPALVDERPADNCTAVIVPNGRARDGRGMFGQTWDMHASSMPYVILLRIVPEQDPAALLFTITGCVGMIGMNAHGICVGINNLLGGDGRIGVTWPFVVRKALQQDNIEDALACIVDAKRAGAHNYLLYDRHDNGYNIEAMASDAHVERLASDVIVHTNHCLIAAMRAKDRPRTAASQAHSEHRLQSARQRLQGDEVSVQALIELTASEDIMAIPAPPFEVDTCGAAIMQPASGDFWAVWGRPSENKYHKFQV